MDADQPTTDPAVPDVVADAPPERRRRSVLGLPVKLALLTLLAITAFVGGIAGFADHRLRTAASDQARDESFAAARTVAEQLTESDFQAANEEFSNLLNERLDHAREQDGLLQRIELYARTPEGDVTRRAGTARGADDDLRDLARDAVRSGDETAGSNRGDATRVAWPIAFSDGTTGAVVAIEYSTEDITATSRTARLRLLLGAIAGGALLGAVVLLLLRRELFRPLEEMRRVMGQIRGGARGARIGWDRGDELGAVADDFDAMVAELEAAQAELGKYVNTDPLTGLLTRDAFTDRFSGELTRARREGYPIALLAIDVDHLDEFNRTHDRDAGDRVLADVGSVIGDCTRPTDACGRTGGDSFHVALVGADAAQAAVVIDRIRREVAQRVGIGPERTRVTCGFGVAEYPSHAVDQLALERMSTAACAHAQRDGRDRALAFGPAGGYVDAASLVPEDQRTADQPAGARELSSTVHALARALDGIDPALGGGAHSQRVARYAVAVARELGMSDADLGELRSAAVLHDVGKVAVPPSILRMPESELDERQRGALRYHAWVSRTMIAGAGLAKVADVVFHIPENWDGTGYPERQREDAIPMASRVLRAAELLDDLTTGRGGRAALDPFRAAGELKRLAGTELDPDVAIALARLVREEGIVNADGAGTSPEGDVADAA
jgi:diguanylate cyclase (GGDEF)-like protein